MQEIVGQFESIFSRSHIVLLFIDHIPDRTFYLHFRYKVFQYHVMES